MSLEKEKIKQLTDYWIEQYKNLDFIPQKKSTKKIDFLGYELTFPPIGIAACPLTGSAENIKILASSGYSLFTYKTIRSHASMPHPSPNWGFVYPKKNLDQNDLNETFIASEKFSPANLYATVNSIGNASPTIQESQKEIATAKSVLKKNQLLIVSIYGTSDQNRSLAQDFAYIARHAEDAGADIIEANFSCPNVSGNMIYSDPDSVFSISRTITKELSIPLIIKIGYCPDKTILEQTIINATKAQVKGITSLNTIKVKVHNNKDDSYFGSQREYAGIGGNAIKDLALNQIKTIVDIQKKNKLDLTLLGCGGISEPDHFDEFFAMGAQAALTASGALVNPYLATEYLKKIQIKENLNARRDT